MGPFLIVRHIPPVNFVLQRTKHSKPFVVFIDKLKSCYSEVPASWITTETSTPTAERQEGIDSTQEQQAPPIVSVVGVSPGRRQGPRRTYVPRRELEQEEPVQPTRLERSRRPTRQPPQYLRDYVC